MSETNTPAAEPVKAAPPTQTAAQKVRARLAKTPAGQKLLEALDKAKTPDAHLTNFHTVEPGESPIRVQVGGDMQMVAEASAMVDGYDLPASLKQFLKEELAELETNACELHVTLMDLPNGDVTLHVHLKGMQLGPKAKAKVPPAAV